MKKNSFLTIFLSLFVFRNTYLTCTYILIFFFTKILVLEGQSKCLDGIIIKMNLFFSTFAELQFSAWFF